MQRTHTGFSVDFARSADARAIREFIHKFWRASHVLSESGELLRWSYLDACRDRLNFVCGRVDEEIVSILGFIPTSHFDPAIPYARDVCLALWKAREDIHRPGIGSMLLRFLQKQLNPGITAVVGINEDVARLYRVLGFEVLDLSHYYRANPAKRDFTLLAGHVKTEQATAFPNVRVGPAIDRLAEFAPVIGEYRPGKTVEHVRNRYLRHPFYRYELVGVWRDGEPIALTVVRKVEAGSAVAVRIVDLFGRDEDLACIGPAVDRLIHEADAEYADFYGYGFRQESLAKAGLLLKAEDVIVPNYFEPFVQANVPIRCALSRSAPDPVRLVRGDSDQDRPNLLPYSE
jgi:ribosomal protein S18 acetylase RimI-like enzyme